MLKRELFTIPNLLTLARIGLIPVYVPLYLQGAHLPAGILLALSCLTDLADGWVARRFHMVSTFGKILDPLADKATQLALMLCLSIRYQALRWILGLFLAKEFFQLAGGLLCLSRGRPIPGTLPAGKVCTALLFVTLTILFLFPAIPAGAVCILALLDAAALAVSLIAYVTAFGSQGKH